MGLFGSKKVSEILVKPDGESVVWKVDYDPSELSKIVKVKITEGSAAIVFKDGGYEKTIRRDEELDWARVYKKENSTISIYGTDMNKLFEMKFGFGEIPFHDDEIDDTVEIGVRGICKFRINDPKALLLAMGTNQDSIKVDTVRAKFFGDLETAVRSKCTKVFEDHGYVDVQGALDEMSKFIQKSIEQDMINAGIMVESCKLVGVNFPEGYVEKYQNKVDSTKQHDEERYDSDKKFMNDLQVIKELGKMNNGVNTPSAKVCAFCHFENDSTSKFCNRCGKKLG